MEKLKLNFFGIELNHTNCELILKKIGILPNLRDFYFNLGFNSTLSEEGIKCVGKHLSTQSNLEKLDLNLGYTEAKEEAYIFVVRQIAKLPKLENFILDL